MKKTGSPKETEKKGFRYSKIPGHPNNALNTYLLVSLVKGIVWLVKTPMKGVIKKLK